MAKFFAHTALHTRNGGWEKLFLAAAGWNNLEQIRTGLPLKIFIKDIVATGNLIIAQIVHSPLIVKSLRCCFAAANYFPEAFPKQTRSKHEEAINRIWIVAESLGCQTFLASCNSI